MEASRSNSPMSGRLYSCREAAKLLDVSDDTIRRLIHAGRLDAVRIGKRILRVFGESLESCMQSQTEASRFASQGTATWPVVQPAVPDSSSRVNCGCLGGAA